MHELSIAQAIANLTIDRAPHESSVVSVTVRAGPMRGIEPDALGFAWRATTEGTRLDGTELRLQVLPWSVRCSECGRSWSSPEPSPACDCGSDAVFPGGSDELTLLSIEVDDV